QAIFQLPHGMVRLAVVGAILGHQESVLAPAVHSQRLAHAPFRLAVVVLPGVVHEGRAGIHALVHDADRRFLRAPWQRQMRAANAEQTHLLVIRPELPRRNRTRHPNPPVRRHEVSLPAQYPARSFDAIRGRPAASHPWAYYRIWAAPR